MGKPMTQRDSWVMRIYAYTHAAGVLGSADPGGLGHSKSEIRAKN